MNAPSGPHSLSTARRAKRLERSCLLCHRRKVRCDKRSPCSNCVRANILCCYPSADEPIRRPRKTTISDVAERLGRLERTLVAITAADSSPERASDRLIGRGRSDSPGVDGDDQSREDATSAAAELLVRTGASSRYVNELILSRILEEEDEIQSDLGAGADESDTEDSSRKSAPVEPLGLLGITFGDSPVPTTSRPLHPPKWQALQLWQVFLNNFESISKTLHVPTAQILVFQALDNPNDASGDANCLLFAVYFAAVTSLTGDEVEKLLDYDKRTALNAFKHGLEWSLVQSNFLEQPTVTSIQALMIFLTAMRVHNTGRSTWILAGMLIRAAQSIGLHRNGVHLNLTPFETEMRRRLWCRILCHDHRASEDYGISVSTPAFSARMTTPPLNVDDSQLYPDMTVMPESREGWTEMSFSLITLDLSLTHDRLQRCLAASLAAGTAPSEAARRELVEGMKARVEGSFLRHYNPVIPAQRAQTVISRVIMGKLDFSSQLQWLSVADGIEDSLSHAHPPRNGGDSNNPSQQPSTPSLHARRRLSRLKPSDQILSQACDLLEQAALICTDDLLRSYRWIFGAFPQYHTLLYVLWYLCTVPNPTGPAIERAWAAVSASLQTEFVGADFHASLPGSKWAVLEMLRKRALRRRREATAGAGANGSGGDGGGGRMRGVEECPRMTTGEMDVSEDSGTAVAEGEEEYEEEGDPSPNEALARGMGWSMGDSNAFDWDALAENVGFPGYDMTSFLEGT
ncbi:hypothetical protein VTK73DRAFT_5634 [Phialemonium thermophilum]|uniref:Zn(2)-C6 fungal-type domain-containing protein n=1 Tax=Phialemonium thermophilum TaxID=223376 RepID=A0ABR3WN04_9PEZI